MSALVAAFDTANEVIAIGLGWAPRPATRFVDPVATAQVEARRASNPRLVGRIDGLMAEVGVTRGQLACVCVGRGPGSFTGVRIALPPPRASPRALGIGLVGVSTLDAVAWGAWAAGVRGEAVAADAMRKEVYPVRYALADAGPVRRGTDRVLKAEEAAAEAAAEGGLALTGDALRRYGTVRGRRRAARAARGHVGAHGRGAACSRPRRGSAIRCATRRRPALVLPVYTRLSDAEEAERAPLAKADPTLAGRRGSRHVTMNDTAVANARADERGIALKPLDRAHVGAVAALEARVMGSDAWSEAPSDPSSWACGGPPTPPTRHAAAGRRALAGYAGGWVVDGDVQVLKVGVDPAFRCRGPGPGPGGARGSRRPQPGRAHGLP